MTEEAAGALAIFDCRAFLRTIRGDHFASQNAIPEIRLKIP
jgi:hypothetical protein